MRCIMIAFAILLIALNLLLGAGQPGVVDTNGHIGGGVAGLLWGFAFFPREEGKVGSVFRKAGQFFLVAFFGVLMVMFFTMRTFRDDFGEEDDFEN